jgi:3-oxoacyl-[acyl-carrier-protein] synthase-1
LRNKARRSTCPLPPLEFSRRIAEWMQLSGPRYSFSNACTSGFSAIDAARSLIAAGQIDEAIVVGIELANNSTLAGFAAMELLSRNTCQPFDAKRDGLVLGEAVAAVRLSAKPGHLAHCRLAHRPRRLFNHRPRPARHPIANVAVDCLKEAKINARRYRTGQTASRRLARHRPRRSQRPAPDISATCRRCSP